MNIYEEEIIEKWFYTYKYNLDIIEIALKRSVTKNNPTLATFDSIITSWYKNGFKTKEEIESYEEKRKSAYAAAKKAKTPMAEQTKGDAEQKGNFKQRNYDEDFLNSFIISEDDNA
jgi:DnaD/phage-associated family protein